MRTFTSPAPLTEAFVAEVATDLAVLSVAIEDNEQLPESLADLTDAQREIIIIAADILTDWADTML